MERGRADAFERFAVVDAVAVVFARIGITWRRGSLATCAVETSWTVTDRLIVLVDGFAAALGVLAHENGSISDENASSVTGAVVQAWRWFARVSDTNRTVSRLTVLVRTLANVAILEAVAQTVVLARIWVAFVFWNVAGVARVSFNANTAAALNARSELAWPQSAVFELFVAVSAAKTGLALASERGDEVDTS